MSANANEIRIYNIRTDKNGNPAKNGYWTPEDGMGKQIAPFPPLEEGASDGIIAVKKDEKGQLYYSYNSTGKVGDRIYPYVDIDPNAPLPSFGGDQPAPSDPYYFVFDELTDTSTPGVPGSIWINGSQVDSTAAPLGITGVGIDGTPFQSGTQESAQKIANDLVSRPNPLAKPGSDAEDTPIAGPSAIIYTQTEGEWPFRVLSPSQAPEAYRSFNPYFRELAENNTAVSILSDIILSDGNSQTENNGQPMEFVGNFTFDADNNVQLQLSGLDYQGQIWTITMMCLHFTGQRS